MFRRKEDSLFDNSTDPNQADIAENAASSASKQTSASSNSTASSTPANGTAANGTPAYLNTSGSSSSRTSEARPASSSASFRQATASSNTPAASDLPRNRMPESKSTSVPASGSNTNFGLPNAGKQGNRVLTVGNDILLKGEIATCDRLVIEGKVDATLNDVHTVEIAETGSFKGSAHIEDAEISGLFEGDLVVRNRLVICATGKVRGTITYGEIEIERGGELTGDIKSNNPATQTSSARPAQQKEEKVAA